MIAWIATHTGLPSFYVPKSSNSVTLTANGGILARVSAGEELMASYPLAPLGTPVVYSDGTDGVTLTRPDDGHMLLTDKSSRHVARVGIVGDDEVSLASGVSVFDSGLGAVSWTASRQRVTGTLDYITTGDDTLALGYLSQVKDSLIALHSPRACKVPGCDIPLVLTLVVRGNVKANRTSRKDVQSREWSIPWRETPSASALVPVVTWGEYEAHSDGWTNESYFQLCKRIGGMP